MPRVEAIAHDLGYLKFASPIMYFADELTYCNPTEYEACLAHLDPSLHQDVFESYLPAINTTYLDSHCRFVLRNDVITYPYMNVSKTYECLF